MTKIEKLQQHQIKSLCEENKKLHNDYERLRDEYENFKTFIREEVVNQIYGQNNGGPELIAKTRAMVSCQNAESIRAANNL